VRFAFIHAMVTEKAPFYIAPMCRLLEVTRQGYYKYRDGLTSARVHRDDELRARVVEVHVESRGTYGSPRVHRALRRTGDLVGKRTVERLMREAGIAGAQPKRFMTTTKADPSHAVEENVLDRDFTATRPNERWVTDITYIWTDEGWCYLAAIIDLFSRGVVGWALSTSLATALPMQALDNALLKREPGSDLLHHSDRGCQYTSAEYRDALAKRAIKVSMSRRGNCWDNAVAESFFGTVKTELIHRQRWATVAEVRAALFDYIETFYNRSRLHSSLDYRTPAEVDAEYNLAA
jgi:putative transposase